MAVDMFIKLDPIKGESKDSKHENEIDILSWSWGMAQEATGHASTGAGAGKVSVQDLNFTHYVDKATTYLMQACATGKHIDKGLLTIRKAGGDKPVEYIKIEMEQIFVRAVTPGGSHGEEKLTENVTLNFHKFKFIYTPQEKTGAPGTAADFKWDIAAHKEG